MVPKGSKLIGRGAFTKAYLRPDGQVHLLSVDPIKECMAWGWFPESVHFPRVAYAYPDRTIEGHDEYIMEYYPRGAGIIKELDKRQADVYRYLVACTGSLRGYDVVRQALLGVPDGTIRKLLLEALDACTNYGSDVCFECSPRNVRVRDGNLVFLDCFFMWSALERVRSGRR